MGTGVGIGVGGAGDFGLEATYVMTEKTIIQILDCLTLQYPCRPESATYIATNAPITTCFRNKFGLFFSFLAPPLNLKVLQHPLYLSLRFLPSTRSHRGSSQGQKGLGRGEWSHVGSHSGLLEVSMTACSRSCQSLSRNFPPA